MTDDAQRRLRHEVRTLIGQIKGYCELLQEETEDRGVSAIGDEAGLADIAAIRQAGQRLLDLASSGLESTIAVAGQTPRPARNRKRASTDGRLLVVDDDAANRALLRRRLERLGCRVEVAEHGRQALQMLGSSPFDLVLLDILMPEMDGYTTLGRLKSEPSLQHVPVIVLSALDDLDSAVRCIELGAEDYLPKPINPSLLRARVETCLEKKRLRDQEAAYLRDVSRVTAAAGAIEAAVFEPASLSDLATRGDALGHLVRVIQGVAAAYRRQALLAEENARLNGVLREQVDELERSRRLIASAEERLRQEIAELLHSRVQNRLLVAWYRLQEAADMLADDPAQVRGVLDEVSHQLDELRERDVRQVSHLLHPSIIQVGLVPAVERLAEDFLPQLRIELEVDGALAELDDPEDNQLPEPVRLAAYRVVEEAFGNAARHARANQVDVALGVQAEQLAIRVRDDGQGFDSRVVRAGLGLSSIAARVGCVGGSWRVSSTPGQGTAVEALLPLDTKRLS